MTSDQSIREKLIEISESIDGGGPILESVLLGLPFLYDNGQPYKENLTTLGFKEEGTGWTRGDERYVSVEDVSALGAMLLHELEQWRQSLLKRAEKQGVAVYIPVSTTIIARGLPLQPHPVQQMLSAAPELRLLFAQGTDHHSELALLLSTGAVTWPQAVRIALEAHASFSVSPDAQSNLAAIQKFILDNVQGGDRIALLSELGKRFGRLHDEEIKADSDESYLKILSPYLTRAVMHE